MESNPGDRLAVGRPPFLVCAPFFHSTLDHAPGVRFVDGVPSFLNGEMHAGRVDCAPTSSFEYGLHYRDYQLFPGISTSSTMEMKSVLFLSQLPWEKIGGQAVALSSDSATSNVLFRILCDKRFYVQPHFVSEDSVGEVFIGDRALVASQSGNWAYRYDLADIWARWQGLPFSFGLWMVRREALKTKTNLVADFYRQLMESLRVFQSDPGKALDAWTRRYPSPLPRSLMLGFYETADYGFTHRHARSLELFYRLAVAGGYLASEPKLDFLDF